MRFDTRQCLQPMYKIPVWNLPNSHLFRFPSLLKSAFPYTASRPHKTTRVAIKSNGTKAKTLTNATQIIASLSYHRNRSRLHSAPFKRSSITRLSNYPIAVSPKNYNLQVGETTIEWVCRQLRHLGKHIRTHSCLIFRNYNVATFLHMEPHNRELDVPCQCMSYPVRIHYYTAIYNKI